MTKKTQQKEVQEVQEESRKSKQTPATTRQRRRRGVPDRNAMKQCYDILHLQREHQAQRNLVWLIDACCVATETSNTCLHIRCLLRQLETKVLRCGRGETLQRALLALPQATLACSATAKTRQSRKQSACNQQTP